VPKCTNMTISFFSISSLAVDYSLDFKAPIGVRSTISDGNDDCFSCCGAVVVAVVIGPVLVTLVIL